MADTPEQPPAPQPVKPAAPTVTPPAPPEMPPAPAPKPAPKPPESPTKLPDNFLHHPASAPEVVEELGDAPAVLSPAGHQRLDALRAKPNPDPDEAKEKAALEKVEADHAAYVKRYHEMTDKKAAGPFSVEQWRHLKTWMRRELAMHVGGHTEESRKVLNP